MTDVKIVNKPQIYFFPLEEKNIPFCQLKLLTNFIKFNYKNSVFKFSYIDSEGSLLGDLTLKENIKLSSDHTDIDDFTCLEMEQILENFENYYLTQLYKKIETAGDSSVVKKESIKIASLVKSFFRSGPYYLYHSPEKYLSIDNLNLFKKALEIQLLTTECTILIASDKKEYWQNFATHMVKRSHNKKFQVLPIIKDAKKLIKDKPFQDKEKFEITNQLIMKNLDYKKVS